MIKKLGYILCTLIAVTACAQMDNYFRPEANREMNEVENYYYKGKEAEKTQQWEQAHNYYKQAYKLAKERNGIIYFEDSANNNYFITLKVLYRAINEVKKKVDASGTMQIPISLQRVENTSN